MTNIPPNSIEKIAHDFNYALQLIIYNVESELARHGVGDPEHAPLQEIRDAAERAVALNRQLVKFVRQNPTEVSLEAVMSPTSSQLRGKKENYPGGTETILLVDDNKTILKISEIMLQRLGYTVLPANSPADAIKIASEQKGKFQLLMTDMVMPEMTGKELADQIVAINPGLKVLFMSGFTSDVTGGRAAVVDNNKQFIQKPFTMNGLSFAIRNLLDA